jgi:spermidine/putrescine transport system substrate-binding protein
MKKALAATRRSGMAANDRPETATQGERLLSRRHLLGRAARFGIGLPTAAWLLEACGGQEAGTSGGDTPAASGVQSGAAPPQNVSGTAVLLNYQGWIGEDEVGAFEQHYPNATIKQAPDNSSSIGAKVQIIKNSSGSYDFSLGDQSFVGQAVLAGIIQDPDWSHIPNIKYVDESFRTAFEHGIPTDYGKVGIGYRKDLVSEPITGWKDVWELAPKYSGQIVFLDLDRDCMGSALKYLGYSGNSTNHDELDRCAEALISIKPHLEALKAYNVGTGLVKGTTAIGMDWDFDIALAKQKNDEIEWVLPEEGAVAYLEGWVAMKDTANIEVVEAFMNWHLDPRQYADFVNTTGTAYVEDAAKTYIKPSIAENPILFPDEAVLANVEYEKFLGEATAEWARVWDEFKSA